MSHFAEVDKNNIVLRVLVGNNKDLNEGLDWLNENLGGTWIKTSYNGKIRKNFAGIGYIYDNERDAFIAPQCHADCPLDEETCRWDCHHKVLPQ